MRTVIFPQRSLPMIKESEGEVTFYEFFTNAKEFVKDLLEDPIGARPNDFFASHGISNGKLRSLMIDRSIIVKSEKIDEPNDDESGEQVSRYHLSFKVPRANFKRKMKRLYQSLFQ